MLPFTEAQNALFTQFSKVSNIIIGNLEKKINPFGYPISPDYLFCLSHDIKNHKEDYEQTVQLALIECIRGFDPDRNVKFITYFYSAAYKEIINFNHRNRIIPKKAHVFQKSNHEKYAHLRELGNKAGSAQMQYDYMNECLDKERSDLNEIDKADLLQKIHERLNHMGSDKDCLIKWKFEGKSLREVGQELGISRERVRQKAKRAVLRLLGKNVTKVKACQYKGELDEPCRQEKVA